MREPEKMESAEEAGEQREEWKHMKSGGGSRPRREKDTKRTTQMNKDWELSTRRFHPKNKGRVT